MILLRVMMYIAKQLFFETPPEIHCYSLNFQYFAMEILGNIVQKLHYYMENE